MLAANAEDIAGAEGQTAAIVDRLRLDPGRVAGIAAAVLGIAELPDPIGAVLRDFTLENGIRIRKLRVPLGVVLVVFEAGRTSPWTPRRCASSPATPASCAGRGSRRAR